MVITYSLEDKEYILNNIRTKEIGTNILVTTDHGTWVMLSKEEFKELISQKIKDKSLLSILREKGILITESNTSKIMENYRKKCQPLFQGTSLHIIVLTSRCNQKCVYCHSNPKQLEVENEDMDEKTAKKTVDFIFQTPSPAIKIEFQGGEPLLNLDILKYIISYSKQLNKKYNKQLHFSLVTNLTLMNDKTLEYLIKEEVGLCTSLDGDEIIHNKNRGDYKKIVEWIKKIKKKYGMQAMTVITKQSLNNYKEIIDEYFNLGLETIWLKPVNKLGNAQKNWKEIGYTSEEFLEFWKKSLDYLIKLNKEKMIKENSVMIILKKIFNKQINFTDLQSPCGAIIGQMAYLPNGNIHTCDEGKLFEIFKIGTVNQKYKEILTSNQSLEMVATSINDALTCDNCAYKPYCGVCPVCSYAETGNVITKIPCNRCKIWKGMFDYVFEKIGFDEEFREVFFKWLEINR